MLHSCHYQFLGRVLSFFSIAHFVKKSILKCCDITSLVLPGIGKTTLVQKVCKLLHDTGISTRGFFTEEIRDGRTRIGFDVVTLKGERGALARLS